MSRASAGDFRPRFSLLVSYLAEFLISPFPIHQFHQPFVNTINASTQQSIYARVEPLKLVVFLLFNCGDYLATIPIMAETGEFHRGKSG